MVTGRCNYAVFNMLVTIDAKQQYTIVQNIISVQLLLLGSIAQSIVWMRIFQGE
jgi:hypothetical protein